MSEYYRQKEWWSPGVGRRESQTSTGPRPVRNQAAWEEVKPKPSPQAHGKTGPWCKTAGDSRLMGYSFTR